MSPDRVKPTAGLVDESLEGIDSEQPIGTYMIPGIDLLVLHLFPFGPQSPSYFAFDTFGTRVKCVGPAELGSRED